jgi:hypothetical protein
MAELPPTPSPSPETTGPAVRSAADRGEDTGSTMPPWIWAVVAVAGGAVAVIATRRRANRIAAR